MNGCMTIVLVDSVINTGREMLRFVKHIRHIHATVRIVIVAGVAQQEFIGLEEEVPGLRDYNNVQLITLRISKNKYTGKKETDTGNRL